MEAGGSGVIFGRNVWQREWTEALEIIEQIKETLLSNVRRIPVAPVERRADSREQPAQAEVAVTRRRGRWRGLCCCWRWSRDRRCSRPASDDGRIERPEARLSSPGGQLRAPVRRGRSTATRSTVRLPDGEVEDVRYIGVDTPESVDPEQPSSASATRPRDANERLVGGRR